MNTKEETDDLESKVEQFNDLKKRVVVSSLVIACLIAVIYFSQNIFGIVGITSLAAILGAIGLWEYATIASRKGIILNKTSLIAFGVIFILSMPLADRYEPLSTLPWVILMVSFFVFFLQQFRHIQGSVAHISVNCFGMIYVAVPLGLLLGILYPIKIGHFASNDGRLWLTYLLIMIKGSDIGAYFGGKLLGKHKLAPQLSPKKTIEGAIAGLITALIMSVLFSFISTWFKNPAFQISFLESLGLGAILSIAGQFGDLSESLFKRDAEVKDSNNLPGLGGVLDTFDSLLFGIPVLYFYLSYL